MTSEVGIGDCIQFESKVLVVVTRENAGQPRITAFRPTGRSSCSLVGSRRALANHSRPDVHRPSTVIDEPGRGI
jgi:hypothetical protein